MGAYFRRATPAANEAAQAKLVEQKTWRWGNQTGPAWGVQRSPLFTLIAH